MRRLILLLLILLIPSYAVATYKIYLKNGSEIPGVKSFSESGEDIYLYFSAGQMVISRKDVLKIEGSEAPESKADTGEPETQNTRPSPDVAPHQERPSGVESPSPSADTDNKAARLSELRSERDSVISELKAVQEQENRLVKEINEKTGRRYSYNLIQMKQLEKEVEPLKSELSNVQQRKSDLLQRKDAVENEMRQVQ
ncbi:MAG TPA: hypothetical protein VK435_04970 [Thermodesulfovibrionales bacterium]|nr:hypothetical protein [Thermodesulfovibrionales bacterium]